MNVGRRVWLGLAATLGLCGCRHDPCAEWFVTEDIPEKVLAGSYHVTKDTLEHFAKLKLSFVEEGRLPLSRYLSAGTEVVWVIYRHCA